MCGAFHTIIKHLLSMKNLSALIAPVPLRFEYGAGNHQSATDYKDYFDPMVGLDGHSHAVSGTVYKRVITFHYTQVVTSLAN